MTASETSHRASSTNQCTSTAIDIDLPDSVRRSLFRLAILPGWFGVGVLLLVPALDVTLPLTYQLAPFAVSLLFLGLPHGAVDHLAPWRARSVAVTPARLGAVGGLYLLLGGAVLLSWRFWPVAVFVFFIVLTWLHWGQGELYPLIALAGVDYLTDEPSRWLAVLARGSLPMLVPLVAFPDQYRLVAETLTGIFGVTELGPAAVAFTPQGRAVTAALVATLCGTSALLGLVRTADRRVWLFDVSELVLLTVYFLAVPPILAVGWYFCLWHSLRHVVRLIALDERSVAAIRNGRPLRAGWRFARDAAPLTLLSIALVAGIAVLVPRTPEAPLELVGVYLVVIAALTAPHVVIVSWLDRQQHLILAGKIRGILPASIRRRR